MSHSDDHGRIGLRDIAFERIRALIISGVFAPGERLIEETIGLRLGMSRNPVRESLKMLEREGFVTIQPFRGAVVSQLGRSAALEVFELREILESFAARKASLNATSEDVTRLRQLLRDGTDTIRKGRISSLPALNSQFHSLVHEIAANTELTRSLEQLRLKVEWMFQGYVATRGEDAWQEHELIVDAIALGDPELASEKVTEHVQESRAAYFRLLEDQRVAG